MASTETFAQSAITIERALEIVTAGQARAAELGKPSVIAVLDPGGTLKALARMDNAPLLAVQIAQDKAYTAVAYGLPTHQWFEFIQGDEPLRVGIVHTPRLVVFGGGYPITADGQVIGGIGVSGGHYSDDMDIAQAAMAAGVA
jgi:uncharacterized protein GlcG (DUF336 family)